MERVKLIVDAKQTSKKYNPVVSIFNSRFIDD